MLTNNGDHKWWEIRCSFLVEDVHTYLTKTGTMLLVKSLTSLIFVSSDSRWHKNNTEGSGFRPVSAWLLTRSGWHLNFGTYCIVKFLNKFFNGKTSNLLRLQHKCDIMGVFAVSTKRPWIFAGSTQFFFFGSRTNVCCKKFAKATARCR